MSVHEIRPKSKCALTGDFPFMSDEPIPALQIQVHFEDGRVTKFVQAEPMRASAIISHLVPARLFIAKQLILAGTNSLSAIQTAFVVSVDFISDSLPKWEFLYNARDIEQVEEAVFRSDFKPENYGPVIPPAVIEIFAEIELVSGKRMFVRMKLPIEQPNLQPIEMAMFLQNLIASHGFYFRRLGGGLTVINPAQIVRFTFYPGPAHESVPANAWQAEMV